MFFLVLLYILAPQKKALHRVVEGENESFDNNIIFWDIKNIENKKENNCFGIIYKWLTLFILII